MMWDHRYRQLAEGEIIRETDECLTDSHLGWQPAKHTIGQPAPSPLYTAHRIYRRLKEIMEADANGWMPIDTAPKDGTEFLTYAAPIPTERNRFGGDSKAKTIINQWKNGAWWHSRADQQPTHWQPLPKFPVTTP